MAVIHTGSIVSDISGSVGTETYSRNQGGLFVKTRKGPTAPPSESQLEVTATITALSRAWSDTLTDGQRETWRTYAAQFPEANHWGERLLHNGYARFIAVNFPRFRNADALATAVAPTAPPFCTPGFILTATTVPDMFTIPKPIINEIDELHTLWVFTYIGIEKTPGVNYYSGPWKFLSFHTRTLQAWTAAPLTVTVAPPVYTTGKKIWLRMRIQCSNCFNISPLAQAAAIFDG